MTKAFSWILLVTGVLALLIVLVRVPSGPAVPLAGSSYPTCTGTGVESIVSGHAQGACVSGTAGQVVGYCDGGVLCATTGGGGSSGSSSGSSSGGSSGWTTALDCDFRAQSSQSLSTDGTYTICGATFTKINSANDATAAALTPDAGLVLVPASGTDVYQGNFSVPAVTLSLLTLIPSVTTETAIRAYAWNSGNNAANNYDQANLGLAWTLPASAIPVANMTMKRGTSVNGGLGWSASANFASGNTANLGLGFTLAAADVLEVSTPALGSFTAGLSAGLYDAGWPSVGSATGLAVTNQTISGTLSTSPGSWVVYLGAGRSGSGTSLVIDWARLRIDYRL